MYTGYGRMSNELRDLGRGMKAVPDQTTARRGDTGHHFSDVHVLLFTRSKVKALKTILRQEENIRRLYVYGTHTAVC